MIHRLFIILLAVLLMLTMCSCGSSKKAHRQAEVVEVINSSALSSSSADIKKYLNTDTSRLYEDLQIVITEYDTAQAVDSLTGLPPVKREIKVDRRKDTEQTSREEQAGSSVSRTDESSHTHIRDSVYTESVREHAETTVPKQIGNAVWAVCRFMALLIVLFLVRRFCRG